MRLKGILEYKKGYPFILLFFSILYFFNFPREFFIGGDAIPVFLNTDFYLNGFIWNDGSLLGGVSTKTLYVGYYIYMYIYSFFINIFGYLGGQFIYNGLLFLLSIIILYSGVEYHLKKKQSAILVTIFYALSIIGWWVIFHRGLLYITLIFFSAPLVLRLLISSIKNKIYYGYLLLFGFLLFPIISNPGYFIPWIFFGIFYIIYYLIFIDKNIKSLKRILIGILIFMIPFISGIVSYGLFFKYNNAITQDKWNTEVLLKNTLNREKKTNNLTNMLRGYQPSINSYWGYNPEKEKKEYYYTFPGKELYGTVFFKILSWLPLVLIIIGLLITKDLKIRKQLVYWIFVLMFSIFLMKSSAAPFGEIFEWLMNNIPLFGIFRSPHSKFAVLFLLSIIFIFILLLSNFEKNKNKKYLNIFSLGILIYTVLFGYYWFIGKAMPKIKVVKNIPNEYIEASKYIKYSGTKKIIIAPFNSSTWTNTDFGYEGYSIFMTLLPEVGIWNKNDGAFSLYSKDLERKVGFNLINNSGNLLNNLIKFNVDTIIYDGYTDRYPRFRFKETHTENLLFLEKSGLIRKKEFGKISIWKVPKELLKPNMYSINGKLVEIKKISSVRYDLKFKSLTKDKLIFLQSFHPEWKLYPKINNGKNIFGIAFGDIKYLFENQILNTRHSLYNGYANSWDISNSISKDNNYTLYFRPQLYFYIGLLISIFLSIIVFLSLIINFIITNKKNEK